MSAIETYINHFSETWADSPEDFPPFSFSYSDEEKRIRENRFNKIQDNLKHLQAKKNRQSLRNSDPGTTFFPVFREMMEDIFGFEKSQLEIILSDSFKSVSKEFFYQARKFGPEL